MNQSKAGTPGIFEDYLLGCSMREAPKLIPGLLLIVALVALVVWLTDLLNTALGFTGLVSYILVVIVVGMLLRNVIAIPAAFVPGISFGVRKLLRLGIILMGIRLSIFDVLKIGAWGIPIVLACVLVGLVVTSYLGRLLSLPERLVTLIAVGTGICGASAIVATAPGIEAKEEEVSYAIASITIFGIIAMVAYPFLMRWAFGANTTMIGLFLGTAVHETSQVAASGMIYDQTFAASVHPTVLDVATVTKLVRNVMMAVAIPAMTFIYARRSGLVQLDQHTGVKKAFRLFPLFVLGFLSMAVIRSVGDASIHAGTAAFGLWGGPTWTLICNGMSQYSGYILATAMASVGLSTSFKSMKGLGFKPFYVGLFAAVTVGITAAILIFALGRFVSF